MDTVYIETPIVSHATARPASDPAAATMQVYAAAESSGTRATALASSPTYGIDGGSRMERPSFTRTALVIAAGLLVPSESPSSHRALAGEPEGAAARAPVKVFVLGGQSNMEGYGAVQAVGEDGLERKGTLTHLAGNPATSTLVTGLREAADSRDRKREPHDLRDEPELRRSRPQRPEEAPDRVYRGGKEERPSPWRKARTRSSPRPTETSPSIPPPTGTFPTARGRTSRQRSARSCARAGKPAGGGSATTSSAASASGRGRSRWTSARQERLRRRSSGSGTSSGTSSTSRS